MSEATKQSRSHQGIASSRRSLQRRVARRNVGRDEQPVIVRPNVHRVPRRDVVRHETHHARPGSRPDQSDLQWQSGTGRWLVAAMQSGRSQYAATQRVRFLPRQMLRRTSTTELTRRVLRLAAVHTTMQPNHMRLRRAATGRRPRS